MKIEKIAIANLNPAKYNPRLDLRPGDTEYEKLKRSIAEFGYVEPVIWNKQTGNVVGGHQRLKVLTNLGMQEVDCVIVDLDINKEKALNIALNNIKGDWDMDLLSVVLKDLGDNGFDVTLTGFDYAEVESMFDDEDNIIEDNPPDLIDEDEKAPITKRNDIWMLGKHKVLCGDITNAKDIKRLMEGNRANLVVTDPPYNVNYEGGDGKTIQNDNMSEELFKDFLTKSFKNISTALLEGGAFYIWHAESEGGAFRETASKELGKIRQMLIWNKNSFTMGRQDYQWKHESCLYGWKAGTHYFINDRTQSTVFNDKQLDFSKMKKKQMQELLEYIFSDSLATTIINEDKPHKNDVHPTMKPLKLLARLIKNSSRPKELVLDTFLGSGSTMIACEQIDRTCYGMEIDPKYMDVIVKRYVKFKNSYEDIYLLREGKMIEAGELDELKMAVSIN